MLKAIIVFSIRNKFLVLAGTAALIFGGIYALRQIPLDAIPDLSDTQVIVYTEWPGQAPQIVQDQVTYPITTKMLSVPKAKVVRGYSFYGFSFVYVIFEDGTDPYWARSRVLEYLNGLPGSLPADVTPRLGPDATGVGWAFMYALNSKNHDLAELRSMQDWFLRYQLSSVEGVAEVASVGGFVKQYQITVDPHRLHAYNLSISDVAMAVQRSNGEVGGRSIEMAEKEFMLRVRGYVSGVDDLRKIAVGRGPGGTPILLGEVANVQLGPDMRRGIAELNGEGETVGGIVVVRYGVDTRQVIQAVKARLDEAMKSLPDGRQLHHRLRPHRAHRPRRQRRSRKSSSRRASSWRSSACCSCMHLRSAFVAIVILPIAVLASFMIMFGQGLSSNIMSLGGIAIAVGAMVDAVIIMIENAHKHLERDARQEAALGHHSRCRRRGRPHAFLLAAGHHGVVPAGVHAAGAGGPDVQAARVHQDLLDGGGRAAVHHARAGADGLLHPRPHPGRGEESDQPPARLDLSSAARFGDPVPLGRDRHRGGDRGLGVLPLEPPGRGAPARRAPARSGRKRLGAGVSLPAPRLRIHAAALRGRPALHADDLPRHFADEGPGGSPADRPDHPLRSPRCSTSLARSAGPKPPRIRPRWT